VNISEPELRDLYARAGCVAYAPVREPFGLVALEAMAAAAPLVAVNEGGLAETIIPDVTGIVAPRESSAFGQAITCLLNNPAQAEHLGNAARRHVSTIWTWEQHITHLEQLLADTAHQHTTRPIYSPM
jgi:glycosyltransferase involved in cell wall biosynthesis